MWRTKRIGIGVLPRQSGKDVSASMEQCEARLKQAKTTGVYISLNNPMEDGEGRHDQILRLGNPSVPNSTEKSSGPPDPPALEVIPTCGARAFGVAAGVAGGAA